MQTRNEGQHTLAEYVAALEFIAREDAQAAALVHARVEYAAEVNRSHPGIGTLERRRGTREFPVPRTSYTLVYVEKAARLAIPRVMHQRRNYL